MSIDLKQCPKSDQVEWPRPIIRCTNCGVLLPDGYSSGGKCVDRFTEHAPETFLVMPRNRRDEELRERLLSDAVIEEAHRLGSMADPLLRPVNRLVIEAAFRTALDSIFEEADDG